MGNRGNKIVFSWAWKENRKGRHRAVEQCERVVRITDGLGISITILRLTHARIGAMAMSPNPKKGEKYTQLHEKVLRAPAPPATRDAMATTTLSLLSQRP
jgi:hypothetical protein